MFWGILRASAWAVHAPLGEGNEESVDILLKNGGRRYRLDRDVRLGGILRGIRFLGLRSTPVPGAEPECVDRSFGQGLVVGRMHAYWRTVVMITMLGILFCTLAAWRKSLPRGWSPRLARRLGGVAKPALHGLEYDTARPLHGDLYPFM